MGSQWLNAQSFQSSQNLLSAINALSIHIKLKLSGIQDNERTKTAIEARKAICQFLDVLNIVVQKIGTSGEKPVVGIDSRMKELAKNFINTMRDSRFDRKTPLEVRDLVLSEKEEDCQDLLDILHELRILLEEHVHIDTKQLLGDI